MKIKVKYFCCQCGIIQSEEEVEIEGKVKEIPKNESNCVMIGVYCPNCGGSENEN